MNLDPARGRADRATSAVQSRRIGLIGQAIDYRLIRAGAARSAWRCISKGLTVRAPRWVTLARHRGRARGAARMDRPFAGRMARAAPRRDAARMEIRRADRVPRRANCRSRSIRRGAPTSRPISSISPSVTAGARRAPGRALRARVAAGPGVDARAPRGSPITFARIATATGLGAAVERPQRMGKLQREGRDPPQLAAGAAAADARRIRRRA